MLLVLIVSADSHKTQILLEGKVSAKFDTAATIYLAVHLVLQMIILHLLRFRNLSLLSYTRQQLHLLSWHLIVASAVFSSKLR